MWGGRERDYPLKSQLNTSRQSPYGVSQVHIQARQLLPSEGCCPPGTIPLIDNVSFAGLALIRSEIQERSVFMRKISRLFALTIILGLLSVPITAVASYDDGDQPHMQAALEALQQAKHHLEEAKHDKGGHRAAAIKDVDSAIHHVKEGMEAGEKHEHK
jgi:hypothetical protein